MADRPILFSGAMVRAILDGRKTQTRRPITAIRDYGQVTEFGPSTTTGYDWHFRDRRGCWNDILSDRLISPYGQPGERLWVKETWRPYVAHNCTMDACDCADVNVNYAADGACRFFSDYEIDRANPEWCLPKAAARGNVSPLFLPRWASRLLLEVTNVRAERLQDISDADAEAEGCSGGHGSIPGYGYNATPSEHFKHLWCELYGAETRDANPWVWAISFKRSEVANG